MTQFASACGSPLNEFLALAFHFGIAAGDFLPF